MKAVKLVVLAVVIAAIAAQTPAPSPCLSPTSSDECKVLDAHGNVCIFDASAEQCKADPCTAINDAQACLDAACLPMPFVQGNGPSCMHPQLLCNRLKPIASECGALSICAIRNNICESIHEPKKGKTDTECDLKFPGWSIALVVIWLCIMAILGFIIFLIMSKGKQAGIKSVQREEVVVDSVQIRDSFHMQQPLMSNQA